MNVREEPSLRAKILGTLSKGTEVEVCDIVDDFLQIPWDKKTGANTTGVAFVYYNGGKFAEQKVC